MSDITVTFTKEEADAAYTQLVGRLDAFDELIKEEGKKSNPSANRLVELGTAKKKIQAAADKLLAGGAGFWC